MTEGGFVGRRRWTFGLAAFFIVWYGFQLAVLNIYGDSFARWVFYTELPPRLTGGLLFSPISHDLYDLRHLAGNLLFLFIAGGVAEPYLGKWDVPGLVVIGGYVGLAVTRLSAPILEFWPIAGASAGVTILWAYSGLSLWSQFDMTDELPIVGSGKFAFEGIEEHGTVMIVACIPAFFLAEVLYLGNMSHAIGLVLGVAYFYIERVR